MSGSGCLCVAQRREKGVVDSGRVFGAVLVSVRLSIQLAQDAHLVCACRHDPVAIFANSYALTGFLKAKVLEELHAIGEFGVIFQTPTKPLVPHAS